MKILNLKSIKKINLHENNVNTITHNKKALNNSIFLSSKEWYNSVYKYNVNNLKHLPVIDNIIVKLIKGYFNMYNKVWDNSLKINTLSKSNRKVMGNQIWISKTELKHTNDKIIINIYVYDRKNNFLSKKLEQTMKKLYINNIDFIKKGDINTFKITKKFSLIIKYYKEKLDFLIEKLQNVNNTKQKETIEYVYKYIVKNIYVNYIKNFLKKELYITYNKKYLLYNTLKYKNTFIVPLRNLIGKIYKKKIIFNIVSLKNYFLNSDIMTQIISTKARNRNNRILKILRTALGKVKTPSFSKNLIERKKKILETNTNILLKDKIELISNNDSIDFIIKNMFRKQNELNILNTVKNKVVTGIRLESSGRLTRRFTAQRSILKFKYKGTLKSIDSSYRGLSSKPLRNNIRSNLQYTKSGSQNRIGAFGIKGWISSI